MAESEKKESSFNWTIFGALMVAVILVLGLNFFTAAGIDSSLDRQEALVSLISVKGGASSLSGAAPTPSASSGVSSASFSDVIPKGVPRIYGAELGVSYDDVSVSNQQKANDAIAKMARYDNDALSGETLSRYIAVTTNISCEYCCGADAITFSNGQAACGCAHSGAMRGLAKYLLEKHPNEFTNDQILEELGKWKALYFPSNMAAKAQVLQEQGIELNYINLASNKYKGIENGAVSGSTQVGGC
ncbi:MAG: hypothetical protein V1494_05775 [Candidatus Diapherotrites archaeon]